MNYKQLESEAKSGSQFSFEFYRTVSMCQTYASMLKAVRRGGKIYLSENRLKELISENVDTLKCFVACLRN